MKKGVLSLEAQKEFITFTFYHLNNVKKRFLGIPEDLPLFLTELFNVSSLKVSIELHDSNVIVRHEDVVFWVSLLDWRFQQR